MKIGVIGSSLKADERRVPIHPEHLGLIPDEVRRQLVFEQGYGERFGVSDQELAGRVGGLASREELLELGAVLLLKPAVSDLQAMPEGGLIWGWCHCVQQSRIAQSAIDRRLTLLTFEAMYAWGPDGLPGRHSFYKNNELAGYCAVLHGLSLKGIDGLYGRQRKAVILGFGAVSRGAIYALKAHGFTDITVCLPGPEHLIREEIPGYRYLRVQQSSDEHTGLTVHDGTETPLIERLASADILVNAVLQDPEQPLMFVSSADQLKAGCLILDVSCDQGMGFAFARPTSFREPLIQIGHVDYYAVDHTPSYLWESASWEISRALLPYLPTLITGNWNQNPTLARAIEIEKGVIRNPKILSFQNRQSTYPHPPADH
ncbi:MAG: N(5)-(carboxyethyl)ornithine synthase [Candidatus Sericytochromatia bacterium]